jgi:uncharacterized protein with von Willebrand factor type A (vWA) domain
MRKFDRWDDAVWESVKHTSRDILDARRAAEQFGQDISDAMVRQIFGALYRRFSIDIPAGDPVGKSIDLLLQPVFESTTWQELHDNVVGNSLLSSMATGKIAALLARVNNTSSFDLGDLTFWIDKYSRELGFSQKKHQSLEDMGKSSDPEIREAAKDSRKSIRRKMRSMERGIEKKLERLQEMSQMTLDERKANIDAAMRSVKNTISALKEGLAYIRSQGISEDSEPIDETQKISVDTYGFSLEGEGSGKTLSTEMIRRMSTDDLSVTEITHVVRSLGRITESFGDLMRPAKIVGRPGSIVGLSYGKAIEKLTPLSLATMDEEIFDLKFATGKLEVYQTSGLDNSKGPIIVAVDDSGSMGGEKIIWAKALALAIAKIAAMEGRDLIWVRFEVRADFNIFRGGKIPERDVVRLISDFRAGGTDFRSWMNGIIENADRFPAVRKADLLLITDGECQVEETYIQNWEEWRKSHDMRSMAVYVGDGRVPGILYEIVDRVDPIDRFTSKSGQDAIGRVIGTLTGERDV